MDSGPTSSPACATVWRPASRAAAKTSLYAMQGLPISCPPSPMPMMRSLGSARDVAQEVAQVARGVVGTEAAGHVDEEPDVGAATGGEVGEALDEGIHDAVEIDAALLEHHGGRDEELDVPDVVAAGVGVHVGHDALEILGSAEERLQIEKILDHDAEAVHVEELAEIGRGLERGIGPVFLIEA